MKLAIVIPIHDKVTAHTFVSMCAFVAKAIQKGWQIKLDPVVGCSNLPHGRNVLLQEAYDWGADIVLSVDDDMTFTPEHAFAVVTHANNPAAPTKMVSATCMRKKEPPERSGYALKDGEHTHELIEMESVGLAFTAIHRDLLTVVMAASPTYLDEETGVDVHAFCEIKVEEIEGVPRFKSEDRIFCDKVRAGGGRIWMAEDIRVGHVGFKVY